MLRRGTRLPGDRVAGSYSEFKGLAKSEVLRLSTGDHSAVSERGKAQAASIPFSSEQDSVEDRAVHLRANWTTVHEWPVSIVGFIV